MGPAQEGEVIDVRIVALDIGGGVVGVVAVAGGRQAEGDAEAMVLENQTQ